MKSSTKRALSLVLAALLVVMSLVVYASLIRPEYQTVQELRGQFNSKSNLYSKEQLAITQVQKLIADYQTASQLGSELSLALPSEESVSSIMSQLNAISRLNGISINSVGIEYLPIKPAVISITSAKGLGTLRLSLRLIGSYESFKGFLSDIELNSRIMDIQLITLSHTGGEDGEDFTFDLNVDTYYQATK